MKKKQKFFVILFIFVAANTLSFAASIVAHKVNKAETKKEITLNSERLKK